MENLAVFVPLADEVAETVAVPQEYGLIGPPVGPVPAVAVAVDLLY